MTEVIERRIKELEEELSRTKYNKATEFHFAVVRAQISKLRQKLAKRQARKKGKGFSIKKEGDATVVFVGFPSVGKSTLLNALTRAHSKIAAYDFTTLDVVPGTLGYKGARIQLLDVPGILYGAASGSGRGKEVLAAVRTCDLVLIMVDPFRPEHHPIIMRELRDVGIRINSSPPAIKITKKPRGGIDISALTKLTKLSPESIKGALKEIGITNADVLVKEDIDLDRLIDAIEANKVYIPAITVINKIDLVDEEKLAELAHKIKPDLLVSAEQAVNIAQLKELIFTRLDLIRIFMKQPRKRADMSEPLIAKKGATLRAVCAKIHRDFVRRFRFARIWGKSAKFKGQVFRNLDKQLNDGDIVELHLR